MVGTDGKAGEIFYFVLRFGMDVGRAAGGLRLRRRNRKNLAVFREPAASNRLQFEDVTLDRNRRSRVEE